MNEVWKPVQGYEGAYEVSSLGRIRSLDREVMARWGKQRTIKGVVKTPKARRAGYLSIHLYRGQRFKNLLIHRVVAAAFIPNPANLPMVNHIDGDKANNAVSNLEWCTALQNSAHALDAGLYSAKGEDNVRAILTETDVVEIRRLLASGEKQNDVAALFGVGKWVIQGVHSGRTWSHLP